jgi:hypothetical protein
MKDKELIKGLRELFEKKLQEKIQLEKELKLLDEYIKQLEEE